MSVRRWSILASFVAVSLVFSCGWVIWALIDAPPGQRMASIGITGILQILEVALAYGLLRLSDYAHTWAMRLYAAKIATAIGLAIGMGVGGNRDALLIAMFAGICGFYAGFMLFLYFNDEFFD